MHFLSDNKMGDLYVRLTESVTYTIPNSPKTLMADFYVLNYISTINFDKLAELGNANALRYSEDFEHDVKYAESVLLPFLQKHMLNSVFFAMCAEIRHLFDNMTSGMYAKNGKPISELVDRWGKFLFSYHKYYQHYLSPFGTNDPRKPSDSAYNKEHRGYQESLAAIIKAAKDNGYSRHQVVTFFYDAFLNGIWNSAYGGKAWANIAKGWLDLEKIASNDYPKLFVQIDHVYDLQHNTDTVFNKLKSYYLGVEGYSWIASLLDFKANVKSIQELFPDCSSQMVKLARPVLKAAGQLKTSDKKVDPETGKSVYDFPSATTEAQRLNAISLLMKHAVPAIFEDLFADKEPSITAKTDIINFYNTPHYNLDSDMKGVKIICNALADMILTAIKHPGDKYLPAAVLFKELGNNPDFSDDGEQFNKPISKFTHQDWFDLMLNYLVTYPEIKDVVDYRIYKSAKYLGIEDAIEPIKRKSGNDKKDTSNSTIGVITAFLSHQITVWGDMMQDSPNSWKKLFDELEEYINLPNFHKPSSKLVLSLLDISADIAHDTDRIYGLKNVNPDYDFTEFIPGMKGSKHTVNEWYALFAYIIGHYQSTVLPYLDSACKEVYNKVKKYYQTPDEVPNAKMIYNEKQTVKTALELFEQMLEHGIQWELDSVDETGAVEEDEPDDSNDPNLFLLYQWWNILHAGSIPVSVLKSKLIIHEIAACYDNFFDGDNEDLPLLNMELFISNVPENNAINENQWIEFFMAIFSKYPSSALFAISKTVTKYSRDLNRYAKKYNWKTSSIQ